MSFFTLSAGWRRTRILAAHTTRPGNPYDDELLIRVVQQQGTVFDDGLALLRGLKLTSRVVTGRFLGALTGEFGHAFGATLAWLTVLPLAAAVAIQVLPRRSG